MYCIREIKSSVAMAKAAFNKKKTLHQQIGLNLSKKLVKCYSLSIAMYGAETWTLEKDGDQLDRLCGK
jgi:inorganic pyrophosphatase